jgi:thiol:disulfide interchange protein DsbD
LSFEVEGDFNMFYAAIHTLTILLVAGLSLHTTSGVQPGAPPHIPPPTTPTPTSIAGKEKGHATVEVRTDVGWVGTSQTFHVIVYITPDTGWHVYWKNPGASGAPTVIQMSVPDGFVIGDPIFPRPTVFHGEEGQTYGYDKPAAIFIPVTAPNTLHDGQVDFEITTSWLACKKTCVMGEQENTLTLSTNAMHQGPLHKDLRLSQWSAALPRPLDDLEGGASALVGNTLHISGETKMRPIRFLGVEQKGIQFGIPEQLVVNGGVFRLPVPVFLDFESLKEETIIIEGILLFGRKSDDPSYVVHFAVDSNTYK